MRIEGVLPLGLRGAQCRKSGDDLGLSGGEVRRLLEDVEVIYHCAAIHPRNRRTDDAVRVNVEGTRSIVELALEACRKLGIEPSSTPTRGGTDGSRLTEMGVPTPNLFTGMQNIHGPHEWISVQDMARATELCITLAELWGEESVMKA